MTGTSNAWPESTTVSLPSNAGSWVPTPSASSTPVTPSGRLSVCSVRFTPVVSSRFFFAAASTSSGAASGPPESSLHAVAERSRPAARRAAARPREAGRWGGSTRSAFHTHAHGDRPGDGCDGLAGGYAGAVPPAGGGWELH